MSQHNCGCGELITPTLDELLAVARSRPLPRVRDRRPPPARLGATLKGWMSWRLIDKRGRETAGGEGPNLVTNLGLDQVAQYELRRNALGSVPVSGNFPIIGYAAVGTDSSSPDASDTALGAEVARTATRFADDEVARPSPGVYQLTRHIEFDYDEGNGVLAEWGFSPINTGPGNLFNRALFLDGGGSPDAITKTNEEKLRITYTLEVSLSPVSWAPGSFTVTGIGTVSGDYMLLGGASAPVDAGQRCSTADLVLFSALARGDLGTEGGTSDTPETAGLRVAADSLSATLYTDTLSYTDDSVNHYTARIVHEERDAYTPGSFTRTGGLWRFDTADGNADPIVGFAIAGSSDPTNSPACSVTGYVFDIDEEDTFSKDDEHALEIGVPVVTWARGS